MEGDHIPPLDNYTCCSARQSYGKLVNQSLTGFDCKIHCEKAKAVVEELRTMKLKETAKKVEDGIEETLNYCDLPSEHWTRIRTSNVIERLNREIQRVPGWWAASQMETSL